MVFGSGLLESENVFLRSKNRDPGMVFNGVFELFSLAVVMRLASKITKSVRFKFTFSHSIQTMPFILKTS